MQDCYPTPNCLNSVLEDYRAGGGICGGSWLHLNFPGSFPISDIRVRAESSESPTLIHSSKLSSADGSSKVLLNWLEDLPNHSHNTPGHLAVSGHNPEPVHIPGHNDTPHNTSHNTPARSPQRQRMLTNGSFVKVKTPLTLNASKLHLEYL